MDRGNASSGNLILMLSLRFELKYQVPLRHQSPGGCYGSPPAQLVNRIVKLHVRDLAFVCNGAIRPLAKAKGFGAKVTGIADGTDLQTTERYTSCGQLTRQRGDQDSPAC
jgi:hypothetical protein